MLWRYKKLFAEKYTVKKAGDLKEKKKVEAKFASAGEDENLAATKIQSIHRAKRDKNRVEELRKETNAQKKIAAVQRGRKARLDFEEKKQDLTKIKKIQAVQRGRQARQDLEKQSKAAAKIAAVHRGNVTRAKVDKIVEEKEAYIDKDQKDEISDFLQHIWDKYDVDKSGGIDTEETKNMIVDITGKSVSTDSCEQFLKSIDTDGDMLIQRDELADFISRGINLSDTLRQQYAARGELHAIIVDFFDGIDQKRLEFSNVRKKEHADKIKSKNLKRRNSSRQPTKAQILEDQTSAATKIQAIQRGKS